MFIFRTQWGGQGVYTSLVVLVCQLPFSVLQMPDKIQALLLVINPEMVLKVAFEPILSMKQMLASRTCNGPFQIALTYHTPGTWISTVV